MGLMRSVMEAEESKFACKLCYKTFPCGKSLGGHLRSHRISRATEQKPDRTQNASPERVKMSPLPLNNEDSSSVSVAYVLRDNPQRFGEERLCMECGKGFRSLKALCGHMACHSDKVTMMSKFGSDDDFSCFDRKLKRKQVVMDTEASSATPRRGKKYNSSSWEQEQEQDQEVARCLMMLSRDSALIGSFPDQSSDNNSVFLEPKSNIQDTKMKNNIAGNFRIHGPNYKVKSVDGFQRNLGLKNHKSCVDAELGKRGRGSQLMKHNKVGSSGHYSNTSVRGSDHELSHKRSKLGHFSHDKNFNHDKFLISKAKMRLGTKKIKGHECPICFRVFRSGQALGGHKRSHFIGGSDGRAVLVLARPQDRVPDLFDLNLPAPEDTAPIHGPRRLEA